MTQESPLLHESPIHMSKKRVLVKGAASRQQAQLTPPPPPSSSSQHQRAGTPTVLHHHHLNLSAQTKAARSCSVSPPYHIASFNYATLPMRHPQIDLNRQNFMYYSNAASISKTPPPATAPQVAPQTNVTSALKKNVNIQTPLPSSVQSSATPPYDHSIFQTIHEAINEVVPHAIQRALENLTRQLEQHQKSQTNGGGNSGQAMQQNQQQQMMQQQQQQPVQQVNFY